MTKPKKSAPSLNSLRAQIKKQKATTDGFLYKKLQKAIKCERNYKDVMGERSYYMNEMFLVFFRDFKMTKRQRTREKERYLADTSGEN